MSRVVAVLVAVALVVGAVIVRNVVLDDDSGASTAGEPVIVCATELRAACDALDGEVRVEDAETTAAALSSGPADVDVWIAPSAWVGIVEDSRARLGRDAQLVDATSVARTPLAVVGPAELDGCDWRCIGDRAGADLDLGARPLTSTIGTLHLGALAGGWFGASTFATNDFDPAFMSWISQIATSTSATNDPVTRLLQSRAFFDAALTYEAEARPAFDGASEDRRAGLALLYPQPVTYLDAVVVGVGRAPAPDVVAAAGDALVDAGWQHADTSADGLPRAGVLVALRELV